MKKILSLIVIIATMVGCSPDREVVEIIKGDDGAPGLDGSNSTPCYIEESEDGLVLSCGENTYYVSNGQDGSDGSDGQDGTDGTNGTDGQDGTSCSVESVEDGAVITCGDDVELITTGGTYGCTLEASDTPNQYLLTCNGLTVELTSTGGSSSGGGKGGGGK